MIAFILKHSNIENNNDVTQTIQKIAGFHKILGVKMNDYTCFAHSFVDSMQEMNLEHFNSEVNQTW